MESRQQRIAAAERVYEDFEPSMDWLREPGADTLRVYVPGFKKEQMKVQVTSSGNLRISGERPLADGNKWCRFRKEIPIPSIYDHNAIGAKFEKGLLFIRHPKIIIPDNKPQDQMINPSTEPPKPSPREAPKPPQEKPQPPAADPPKLKKQPSDVSKPTKPTEPAEKITKLATKIEPAEKSKPATKTEPAETSKPATKMEPAEKSKPATKTEPTETSKPATKIEPAEKSKPARKTEPAETSKPATKIEPAEKSPTTKIEPAETSKPATTTEPARPEKPVLSKPQAANIGMERQNIGKDGTRNRNSVLQQMIEKETVTSKYEQKDRSNGVADTGRDMTTPSTEQEKRADFVKEKTDKNGDVTGIVRGSYSKFAAENLKQVFEGMVMEMKQRNLSKWVMIVLVLVLGLCAIRYLKKSED
ncbi:serine-aspartate repeat-containing protein I [Manihot esculenta]|uniref:SHSP domain-containing protein n=1 Tax=Manihot esculenta TaxID=3983 RepID=A0A2C9VZS9_MANES|nr:serine-aspartate repeat-containing protein I [Manihot esculenta]OAY52074.1 hypothetical protein MANES_04G055300v8 [Manihot esculenta]